MEILLIAAIGPGGVIGRKGTLPWYEPLDLAHFKETTRGSPVLMGRKTFEFSLKKPLPGRWNQVVTRTGKGLSSVETVFDCAARCRAGGVDFFPSPEAAMEACRKAGAEKLFVIGGAELFAATLPLADTLILTRIPEAEPGDVFFPLLEVNEWVVTARRVLKPGLVVETCCRNGSGKTVQESPAPL